MAVRKINGQWCVEFQYRGVRVFRRLAHDRAKADAQALEAKLRSEIFHARDLDKPPELTLEAIVDRWLKDTLRDKKDQRNPRQNADHLRPYLAGKVASDAASVASDVAQKSGCGPATINRRLAVMKAAIRHAWKQGLIPENYGARIAKLREPPGREVYLTRKQVQELADAMPSDAGRRAVLLLAMTGMRASELLTSYVASPDWTISVATSKNGHGRSVPIPSAARGLVSDWPLGLSYQQLQWQFRSARDKAGLPHVRLHDLRHTYASWLVNAGTDLFVVGKLLGHKTPSMTARYSHLQQDTLRKAVARLK